MPLRLAFVLGYLETADIWIIEADGTNLRKFIGAENDQSEPAWSADGAYMAYQSNQNGNYDLWLVDAYGQAPRPLTADPIDEFEPDISHDGTRIAYRRGGERFEDGELWIMEFLGTNARPLRQEPVIGRAPVWSPDGNKIAFMSNRDGPWNIYIFDLESGAERQFTKCTTHCRFPEWSSDGTEITYNVSEDAETLIAVQIWQRALSDDSAPKLIFQAESLSRLNWSTEGWGAFNTNEGIMVFEVPKGEPFELPNTEDGWACDWSR